MTERYIVRETAFLFEVSAQLESFDLDAFRRLYHQAESFTPRYYQFASAPLDRCLDQGVDDFSYVLHHTEQRSELKIVFFGCPNDRLLDAQGNLTHTAAQTIRRVTSYRQQFCKQWLRGSPPLLPEFFSLTSVDFELFIGRRVLGAHKYDAFRDALESDPSLRGIQFAMPRALTRIEFFELRGRLKPTEPGCLVDGGPVRVRSFDQILDKARMVAIDRFPFRDQDLLRTIIQESNNPRVLSMALERLDSVPENNDIFAAHLQSKSDQVRREAVLGITNVANLRDLLSTETKIDKDLVGVRIATLEQDEDTLCDIAMNAWWFDAEFAAIEAINNKDKLSQIVKRHHGESTPRAHTVRTLVSARKAFIDRNSERLDSLLKDADFDTIHPLIRMKTVLQSHAKEPPRVFISYKHESQEQKDWVMKLATDLRERGVNALLDEWEINLGDSLSDYMALEIANSDVMLFIITEGSVAAVEGQVGGGIKFEFQIANARRYQGADFRIVGVLRSGNHPPRHISDNLYIDFRNDREYSVVLERLVDSLLGRRCAPPVRPTYD